MGGVSVFPTKKGDGVHVVVSYSSPPGSHRVSLGFVSAVGLGVQLLREGVKGLLFKGDVRGLKSWQGKSLRESFLMLKGLFSDDIVGQLGSLLGEDEDEEGDSGVESAYVGGEEDDEVVV